MSVKKVKVAPVKKPEAKLPDGNVALIAELRAQVLSLQTQLDAIKAAEEAKKHKKVGHCRHCGRAKIDHFYHTVKCRPNGDVSFEAAK